MTSPDNYPDVEDALITVLEEAFPKLAPTETARFVDAEFPANLQDLFGAGAAVVRVSLVTGRDDNVTDVSVVDIDVLSDSRATSYAWAADIRSRLTSGPHHAGTVIIDRVRTEESPRRLPWADERTWRFGATYRVGARR